MKLKTRKGVILTGVCGEYVLVSCMDARDYCPSITQVNEEAAFIWMKACEGADTEEIIKEIMNEYETDDSTDIPVLVNTCIRQYEKLGLIITQEDQS